MVSHGGSEPEVFVSRCCPPAVRRSSQIVVIGCALALMPITAVVGSPGHAGHAGHGGHPRRLVRHIDVDGDGTPDRLVITLGRDLKVDGRSGRELVLGFDSGASSSGFHVLRYIHGSLHLLGAPPTGGAWSGASDAEESGGYRCTAHGVQTREYGIVDNGTTSRITIDRVWFIRQHGGWHQTKHEHLVRHGKDVTPPKADFGTFRCAGLPKDEI
jgi:hypothetical protein